MVTRGRILFLVAFLMAVPVGFVLVALSRRGQKPVRRQLRTATGLIELPMNVEEGEDDDPPSELPAVSISDLRYASDDEYVEIRNDGSQPVSLAGWQIVSGGEQSFTFPQGVILEPGATLRVHSGRGATGETPADLIWTRAYVWHDVGDAALLLDEAGRTVSHWRYRADEAESPALNR
ncbi:MAG: lamin tail domain-containing protein [Chloroflexi bacterium]|nr:lamin tail domain-containing protein [Chloroflexota bacterium]